MPAEGGDTMTRPIPFSGDAAKRRKVYLSDSERPDLRVPFTEVVLGDSPSDPRED